ncbi:MAG: 3-isopropylmalate dehydratase small subunit [Burkholderiales bacterium PBB5]|nr:MAG: 3-isopropylmalate dehydratase small subunit [Burkholderiales bacterium PBB5]
MSGATTIEGIAAVIAIDNLDTDQIMPKQFLRGIDKRRLDRGLLWDLRFDASGSPRPDFVLNRPACAGVRILIGGANFGCGSSREHAVWGLQQFGIDAVIAPSFGEIFYSNALNNGLLAVMLQPEDVQALMAEAAQDTATPGTAPLRMTIDLKKLSVSTPHLNLHFSMAERHRRMLLDGTDMIGATLAMQSKIDAFAHLHWAERPWLRDVASRLRQRLEDGDSASKPIHP